MFIVHNDLYDVEELKVWLGHGTWGKQRLIGFDIDMWKPGQSFTCLMLHLWACCERSLSPLYAGSMGCRRCCQQWQPQSQTGWRRSRVYQGSCYGPRKPSGRQKLKVKPFGLGQGSRYEVSVLQCTHPITIKSCTKIILSISHGVNQICSIGEVRVWVLTPKIPQWDTVNGRIGRTAQLFTQYSSHIWSYHWGDRDKWGLI